MEQLLNRKQAAEILGYQPQTLGRYAWLGTGPKFMKIGSRAVRYKRSDLEAWIAANDRSVAQTEPVAAHDGSVLEQLFKLWEKATADERTEFKKANRGY